MRCSVDATLHLTSWETAIRIHGWTDYTAGYTLIAKYEKWKLYTQVFCASFFAFRISQHFTPGLAFAQKLEGFRGLFFRAINKTRNSHEMQKVYSECFVFCGVFREKYSQNAKCEKCIAALRKSVCLDK